MNDSNYNNSTLNIENNFQLVISFKKENFVIGGNGIYEMVFILKKSLYA